MKNMHFAVRTRSVARPRQSTQPLRELIGRRIESDDKALALLPV